MNITTISKLDTFKGTLIIPLLEKEQDSAEEINIESLSISVSKKLFSGKKDTTYLKIENNNTYLFVGLGSTLNYKLVKTIFRRIACKQKEFLSNNTAILLSKEIENNFVEALVSGLFLGTYQLGHFKKNEEHPFLNSTNSIILVSEKNFEPEIKRGIAIAKAQLETFALVDLPSHIVTPKYLADWAVALEKNENTTVTVFNKEKSKEIGLHAFLAVGQGSSREPHFIVIDYNPPISKKHIGLVGKGITFDTGGLNIKTSGMLHMKCDMAGAASVLGAMQVIANLELPYHVTAIVPACENAIDATSFYPSDVINSYAGKTIEIIDTDAEGRLILADGISYLIKNYNPEIILDFATLTGSIVATLGYECAGLFTSNLELSNKLQTAGNDIGEKLWPLPLWEEYQPDIESDIADVKNYSGKPIAGAITAAKFLEAFTENHPSWAHIDIAGVAFGDSEFAKTKHATAFGVHLITNFIEKL